MKEKWERREEKLEKRKSRMRVDGGSVKLLDKIIRERAKNLVEDVDEDLENYKDK